MGERSEAHLKHRIATPDIVGTEARTGMYRGEFNAAEIASNRLRFEYDIEQRRPIRVEFEVHPEPTNPATGKSAVETQTDRLFTQDASIAGQEGSAAGYRGSGMDKGHLAQREAFRGYGPAERAVDSYATVVPMSPKLNRGEGSPWRDAERKTLDWARTYDGVKVTAEPIYGDPNLKLPNGTSIPTAIRRRVTKLNGDPIPDQFADVTFLNR